MLSHNIVYSQFIIIILISYDTQYRINSPNSFLSIMKRSLYYSIFEFLSAISILSVIFSDLLVIFSSKYYGQKVNITVLTTCLIIFLGASLFSVKINLPAFRLFSFSCSSFSSSFSSSSYNNNSYYYQSPSSSLFAKSLSSQQT